MADSPENPAPKPTPLGPVLDDSLIKETVTYLWSNRRQQHFRRKGAQMKIKEIERQAQTMIETVRKDLDDSVRQVGFFTSKINREFDCHPEVFKKMGISRSDPDQE